MEFPLRAHDPRMISSSLSTLLLLRAFLVVSAACLLCCAASSASSSPTTAVSTFLSPPPPPPPLMMMMMPPPPPPQGNPSSDRMALLTFRSSIARDRVGALSSWNDSSHFCQWRGVTCSGGRRHPDRVVGLELRSLGLSGPLHPSIANLTFLRRLDLFNNSFHAHIPEEIGRNLLRLRHLDLSVNSLEGEIPSSLGRHHPFVQCISLKGNSLRGTIPPSLGNLSSLQVLDLSSNHLTGGIPPQLGSITTLTQIDLKKNNLGGSIPNSLGNLTALVLLFLSYNSLTGPIPPAIGNLRSLVFFGVQSNELTGAVPPPLYTNLSSLVTLALGSNNLSGRLPPNFGLHLPSLQHFSISNNQFYGPIPSSIGNASSLRTFQITTNAFGGVVPPTALGTLKNLSFLYLDSNLLEAKHDGDWSFVASLTNCTRLASLSLRSNMLQGLLPRSISNLSKELGGLFLSHNRISGISDPAGIGGLVGLTALDLSNNLFDVDVGGALIPAAIGKLQNLVQLDLSNNQLRGKIPSSFCNLTRLSMFYLERNQLEGDMPRCFGNLQSLSDLDLSDNHLSGIVPKQLSSILVLQSLNLAQNSLSGPLPTEVGRLKNLNKMDISDNNLSEEIPSTLGDCQLLVYLDASGNNFRGAIPPSFNKLRGLEILDVSRNNLSGSIPQFLRDFNGLKYLNLSFNNFDGEVPAGGIFHNASIVSMLGNPKLCGATAALLQLHDHLQPCLHGGESKRSHGLLIATIITVPGAVLICVTILVILCIIVYRTKIRKAASPRPSITGPDSIEMLSRITYAELFKATEGFSLSNLIGTGSFGSVYKGSMNDPAAPDSKFVAVKVINLQQHGASKSFMRECEALKNTRHRNLVKILTSCSGADFDGNDFKALVFEYMRNGSLEQWLHPVGNEDCEKQYLGLEQRLNIAVDVALSISYLHYHHNNSIPIVHCDLKPSNVLLDVDMTAHVSDFGLARFLSTKSGTDSKDPTSSLAFKGSIGYVAPEYGMGCEASTEGDVYSYGILLLEMVTGRRPTDALFVDGLTLHKYVQMAFPDRVLDVVDPSLLREGGASGTEDINIVIHGTSSPAESMKGYNLMVEQDQARLACLASMMRLGLACSEDSPKERTQMEAVTREITAIKERFIATGTARGRRVIGSRP